MTDFADLARDVAAGPPLHDDARSLRDPPFLVACGPDAPVPAIDLSEERA